MPYDDIYPVIFQGLALNGFEVALSDTVDIDDKRKCDFIVFVCEAGLLPRLYRKTLNWRMISHWVLSDRP